MVALQSTGFISLIASFNRPLFNAACAIDDFMKNECPKGNAE